MYNLMGWSIVNHAKYLANVDEWGRGDDLCTNPCGYQVEAGRNTRGAEALTHVGETNSLRSGDVAGRHLLYHEYMGCVLRRGSKTQRVLRLSLLHRRLR